MGEGFLEEGELGEGVDEEEGGFGGVEEGEEVCCWMEVESEGEAGEEPEEGEYGEGFEV